MKQSLLKIFLFLSIVFSFSNVLAVNFNDASSATSKITPVSITAKTWDMNTQINTIGFSIFTTIKIAIWALLVVYIVYAGMMMILSMWDDEKRISTAKRSIWHALVGLLFINIPWTLYDAFSWKSKNITITWTFSEKWGSENMFMNNDVFWSTLWWILTFLEIALIALAIFVFVYNGIKIMLSGGEEKNVSEAKNKILRSLAGLIFVWVMEVWRGFVFVWDFKWAGQDLFSKLSNLALFFAGPVAIFFLSMAGYYYITSGWEEEKIKKAKSIVINTLLATLILIWIYTFLLDLWGLQF